eukprot:4919129-Prymnesium_polylepis.1
MEPNPRSHASVLITWLVGGAVSRHVTEVASDLRYTVVLCDMRRYVSHDHHAVLPRVSGNNGSVTPYYGTLAHIPLAWAA